MNTKEEVKISVTPEDLYALETMSIAELLELWKARINHNAYRITETLRWPHLSGYDTDDLASRISVLKHATNLAITSVKAEVQRRAMSGLVLHEVEKTGCEFCTPCTNCIQNSDESGDGCVGCDAGFNWSISPDPNFEDEPGGDFLIKDQRTVWLESSSGEKLHVWTDEDGHITFEWLGREEI